ncbi:hypothetical protein C8R47DRAFT_1084937 [Mycena vitilis]|nr:hypothetical protein C8R47DRAFT_1084937 [Mycena vitilis]
MASFLLHELIARPEHRTRAPARTLGSARSSLRIPCALGNDHGLATCFAPSSSISRCGASARSPETTAPPSIGCEYYGDLRAIPIRLLDNVPHPPRRGNRDARGRAPPHTGQEPLRVLFFIPVDGTLELRARPQSHAPRRPIQAAPRESLRVGTNSSNKPCAAVDLAPLFQWRRRFRRPTRLTRRLDRFSPSLTTRRRQIQLPPPSHTFSRISTPPPPQQRLQYSVPRAADILFFDSLSYLVVPRIQNPQSIIHEMNEGRLRSAHLPHISESHPRHAKVRLSCVRRGHGENKDHTRYALPRLPGSKA